MKIVFTKHAEDNFKRFKKSKINIQRKLILETVNNPDHIDKNSDRPKIIASKIFNDRLVLRAFIKRSMV
jgi:hypothetical protein